MVLLYYALRGGSYDIVLRQEEALVIWWILGLGFAFGLLPRARPPRSVIVPFAAILLLALWTALSLTWTQSGERTFAELARFLHYTGLLLLIWAVVDRRTWRAAAGGLLFAAVVVCALSMISRLWPGTFQTNPVIQSFVDNRLSYPFNYWNAVGAFSVMTSAMALTWSAHARRLPIRAAALAAVPLCESTAYLTYSRAAAFGSVLCVLVVLALSRNRWVALVHIVGAALGSALVILAIRSHHQIVEATGSGGAASVILALVGGAVIGVAVAAITWYFRGDERWHLPRRPARIGVAAAVVLVIVLVPTAGHAEISKGWHQFKKQPSSQNTADPATRLSNLNGNRYYIWRSALRAFKAHPVDGTGAGTFAFWWWSHNGDEFLRDAHSLYLEELGEQGIVGGVLILVFVGGLGAAGLMGRRRLPDLDKGIQAAPLAAFGVYLFHAGVDWMWESTAVTVFAIAAAAIAIAAVSEPAEARARVPLRVGVAGLAAVALLIQLPGLASTLSTRDSQRAFNRGNLGAALSNASDAISAEPWAASPYEQRALVEEAQGNLAAARTDVLRAQSREPTNYQHPLVLARIEAQLGNADAAVAALQRARALRPRSPLVQ
jgi:O-Antigen ligase